MRIILLVLLFLIWESASPGTAHWQLIDSFPGILIFFAGYLLLIAITRLWGGRLARGLVRGDPGRAVDRFNWGMAIARTLIPVWFAAGVFVLGWKPAVDWMLGPIARWPIVTPGTVIALIPGFAGWMGLWWSQFPLDRALREQNVVFQLESDLPVFSAPTFGSYFLNKLRVQLLFTTVPLLAILILRDVAVLILAAAAHTTFGHQLGIQFPIVDSLEGSISFVAVAAVLLLAPELLRRVLHTQRLPESNLRRSLMDLSSDAGIRCREILLWRTQNNLGNAAVMGLFPLVRYVMLSDLLLESMTDQQIRAVFAHELGHVKHRHLIWFVLFFLTVGSCLLGIATALENQLSLGNDAREAFDMASLLLCVGVLIVGFGFLSRWFERQADVFAARTVAGQIGQICTSCGYELRSTANRCPECGTPVHQADAPGLLPSGAEIFASALERVAVVNNIPMNARNWTHGSIQARVRYIHRLGRDPRVAQRFDQTGRRVFVGLIVMILVCGALGVWLMR